MEERNEWIKQIGFFKEHCHKDLPVEEPDMDIADIKKAELEAEQQEAVENSKGHE